MSRPEEQPLQPGYPVQQGMSYPQQPGYNPAYQNPYNNQQQGQQGGQGGNTAFFPPPPPMPHFTPQMMENGQGGQQGNGDSKYSFQFSDQTIRAAFVKKVFSLVFIMLTVVTAVTAIPWLHPPTMKAVRYNMGIYFGGYAVFLITYLSLMCCEGTRRKFPLNLVVTAIFTLSTSVMTMVLCAHHNLDSILMALGICVICTLGIIVFASQTKFDITAHIGYIAIASFCFLGLAMVAVICSLFFQIKFIMLLYAFFGSLLMMVYLMFDIQMLMGGRKYELSPEDYIFAAVQIFMDIVQMFWYLLSLFGNSR
ncbi:unnamed protein product [Caenorhabditis angaria]|uniref:Uncharacterized protein n=1 Tax=Caenorhabditis angaria TaxID=860376 RepID=A0A9P1N7J2_9PELO|nr:unnamed protein product [Caenorhabditis angaria]